MFSFTQRIKVYFSEMKSFQTEKEKEVITNLIMSKKRVKYRILNDLKRPNADTDETRYLNERLCEINKDLNYLNNRLKKE